MPAGYVIRDVEPGDAPALATLERAAPEGARLAVEIVPRIGHLELAARYPNIRGYVALTSDPARIVGMLFSSLAPTQLNGAVMPGAYLFGLRVHPAARRRGIASALLSHARERARAEADAELVWAGVREGNEASLRTCAAAGFTRLRDSAVRIIPPPFAPPGRARACSVRPLTPDDLPALASALNRAHAAHNFWRPSTPERLGAELTAARHGLSDVLVALDRDGAMLAAGAVLDLGRVARFRLLGHRSLPDRLSRALAPAVARLPLRPLLLRHRLLPATQPEAGLALLRSIWRQFGSPLSALAIPMDTRDPAWPVVARAWGLTSRLHVVARSAAPVDESRPIYLA